MTSEMLPTTVAILVCIVPVYLGGIVSKLSLSHIIDVFGQLYHGNARRHMTRRVRQYPCACGLYFASLTRWSPSR